VCLDVPLLQSLRRVRKASDFDCRVFSVVLRVAPARVGGLESLVQRPASGSLRDYEAKKVFHRCPDLGSFRPLYSVGVGVSDKIPKEGLKSFPTTAEWLESPYLLEVTEQAATKYHLPDECLPDLVQELRIALWQAGLEVRVGPAWVRRVALNKAVDVVRVRRRSRSHDLSLSAVLSKGEPKGELEHLLHAKAATLPARPLEVFNLHYQQGFSEREIARELGICRASVRWLDRRCRRL
jgi:RNA polymerase sigma factor (sigma-70 family)